MNMPVEIKVHDLALTDPEEAEIREKAEGLERFHPRIVRIRVTVVGPGGHHRGGIHKARIDVAVPGLEIVINRQSGYSVREAVREAFDAAGRRLEDHVRRVRGDVKRHHDTPEASASDR